MKKFKDAAYYLDELIKLAPGNKKQQAKLLAENLLNEILTTIDESGTISRVIISGQDATIRIGKNKRKFEGKKSSKKRLANSQERKESYIILWRKMKTENPRNSTTKINYEFHKWLSDNNIEWKQKNESITRTLARWRKEAGLK